MILTDRDPVIGWEAIGGTAHPQRRESLLSERLWQARDNLIEKGWFDFEGLENLASIAGKLETAEPCRCVLPEQSCSACSLAAHAVTILQEIGE